jgi:hypothetical protein
MFDDEEKQDEKTPSPARLRFSNWLVGLDPDSDPRLGGRSSGARQKGMTPGTPPADPTETWQELQAKTPYSPTQGIGQRTMQRDAASAPASQRQPYSAIQTGMTPATRPIDRARTSPPLQQKPQSARKLSIGERLMQMDMDIAAGRRSTIAPKLTLGQRLMGLDERDRLRVDNPQARQISFSGPVPATSMPGSGGASIAGNNSNSFSAERPGSDRLGDRGLPFNRSAGQGLERNGLFLGSGSRVNFAGAANGAGATGVGRRQQPQPQPARPLTRDYAASPSPQAGDNVRWAADYLKWRDQNFRPSTGGGWEAPSGRLYTNQALQELYSTQRREAESLPGKPLPATATKKGNQPTYREPADPWQHPAETKRAMNAALAKYIDIIDAAADKYHIPRALFEALIFRESTGDPHKKSPKGAMGLAQLMPAAAKGIKDPYDPEQNVETAAQFLGYLLTKYEGNTYLALQGYNEGPENLLRLNGVPNNKETRDYVRWVLGYQRVLEQDDKAAQVVNPDQLVQDLAEASKPIMVRKAPEVRKAQERHAAQHKRHAAHQHKKNVGSHSSSHTTQRQ